MEVYSEEVECKVSAKRLWKAAFVDGHTCLPKASPHAISHVSYDDPAQGFSHAGCCRTIHFHPSHAEKLAKEKNNEKVVLYMKEKLVEVDHKALKLKFEYVEGGFVGILVKRATATLHIKEGDTPNTCVVHCSHEYEALSEDVKARVPLALKTLLHGGNKQLEEYLLSHDDYKEE